MLRAVTTLSILTAIIVVVAAIPVVLQRSLIYLPSNTVAQPERSMNAEDVLFPTGDGLMLAGWYMPPSIGGNGATVIVFNGNAGNRGDRLDLAKRLNSMGFAVFLFDYRGYGSNPGSPTEKGLLLDGEAAARYVASRSDVDPDKIVYFGESLGTGVAVATAVPLPPALLMLRSPFTSLPQAAAAVTHFPPTSKLIWDKYPNLDTIGRVRVPLLVVAGSADNTIPSEQSIDVFSAAAEPKKLVIIEGADHNDRSLSSGFLLIDDVGSFIMEVIERR